MYKIVITAMMKRPQSAKPGHRGFWGHSNTDQAAIELHPKMVKFMRPDLTTHDFARVLPRRFHHDKERLYSQALQLKQHLNETMEENTKLKTRISVLEREKGKAVRFDTAPSETNQRRSAKPSQKGVVQGLKKLLRESRDEYQALNAENIKIKKTVKYTRINELEIERKILADENARLSGVLEELAGKLSEQHELEADNQELSQALEEEVSMRERAQDAAQQLQQEHEAIEQQFSAEKEKLNAKVKKLQWDLQTQKRRGNEYLRQLGEVKRQLNTLKEGQLSNSAQKRSLRPSSRPNPNRSKKVYTQHSDSRDINSSQMSVADTALKQQKQALEIEVRTLKEELRKAQEQITRFSKEQWAASQATPAEDLPQDDYDIQDFEGVEEGLEKDNRVLQMQEEMQAEAQQEALMEAPPKSAPKKKKPKSGKKEKSQRKGSVHDRKALTEVRQLLTYRMKSQRYPFNDLKSDIQCSSITHFSQADLRTMLVNEPFYLTPAYTQVVLRYLLGEGKEEQGLSMEALVGKLRGLISQFELAGEEQEKQMILRVAQMTSTYPRQLQVAFQNIRNGPQTVSKEDLTDMFLKLQLEQKYIELIIAELSLCSDDLQHLNFHGFFQRFYIEEVNTGPEAIEEIREESEESHKPSSRNLKGSSSLSPEQTSPQ